MSDLSPRIEDLMVRRTQVETPWGPHTPQPRPVTRPELLAVLTSMGAEKRTVFAKRIKLPDGEYVVIPKSRFEGGTE